MCCWATLTILTALSGGIVPGQEKSADSIPDRVVLALANTLEDEDREVRIAAVEALTSLGPRAVQAVPALLAIIAEQVQLEERAFRIRTEGWSARPVRGQDDELMQRTYQSLVHMGNAGIPALADALQHPNARIRQTAAFVLRSFAPDITKAIPALIEALKDREAIVRNAAILALSQTGSPPKEMIPALALALREPEDEYCVQLVEVVLNLGPSAKELVPTLMAALHGRKVEFRRAVARVLGELGPRALKATPTLIQSLSDEDIEVRKQAARALGKIHAAAPLQNTMK